MDFYVDLAVSVLLRLMKDRKQWVKYERALRKVQDVLNEELPPFDMAPVDNEVSKAKR